MRDLLNLIKKMRILHKYVILLILRSPFDALRTWMLAGLLKSVFLCLETSDKGTLVTACMIYGLICALLFFYNGTIWSIYAAFSAKIEARLQRVMLERILDLPFKQVNSHLSGEWITKLNSDIQAAFMMMNAPLNIPHAVVSTINTLLASFLMFGSSSLLFVTTWMFIFPHLFINYKIVLKYMPKLKEESQKALAENTSVIKPLIAEADTILLYDAGDLMMKKCEESSRKMMKINLKIHMRNAFSGVILRLFGSCGYLIIMLMGYRLIWGGMMHFSDVVYCFQVRGSILAGVSMLIISLNNIKANSVCVKRINVAFEEQNHVKQLGREGAYER